MDVREVGGDERTFGDVITKIKNVHGLLDRVGANIANIKSKVGRHRQRSASCPVNDVKSEGDANSTYLRKSNDATPAMLKTAKCDTSTQSPLLGRRKRLLRKTDTQHDNSSSIGASGEGRRTIELNSERGRHQIQGFRKIAHRRLSEPYVRRNIPSPASLTPRPFVSARSERHISCDSSVASRTTGTGTVRARSIRKPAVRVISGEHIVKTSPSDGDSLTPANTKETVSDSEAMLQVYLNRGFKKSASSRAGQRQILVAKRFRQSSVDNNRHHAPVSTKINNVTCTQADDSAQAPGNDDITNEKSLPVDLINVSDQTKSINSAELLHDSVSVARPDCEASYNIDISYQNDQSLSDNIGQCCTIDTDPTDSQSDAEADEGEISPRNVNKDLEYDETLSTPVVVPENSLEAESLQSLSSTSSSNTSIASTPSTVRSIVRERVLQYSESEDAAETSLPISERVTSSPISERIQKKVDIYENLITMGRESCHTKCRTKPVEILVERIVDRCIRDASEEIRIEFEEHTKENGIAVIRTAEETYIPRLDLSCLAGSEEISTITAPDARKHMGYVVDATEGEIKTSPKIQEKSISKCLEIYSDFERLLFKLIPMRCFDNILNRRIMKSTPIRRFCRIGKGVAVWVFQCFSSVCVMFLLFYATSSKTARDDAFQIGEAYLNDIISFRRVGHPDCVI